MDVPLRKILSLLDAASPAEVRRAAVTVLGELGLRGAAHEAARALAGAGAAGGADARELEILLEKDPAVVGAAVQSLASAVPGLDARRKQAVADALLDLAGARKAELSPAGEAGVVRLAGLLDD